LPEILISIAEQQLTLIQDEVAPQFFTISTALNGVGERSGSYSTPRGAHHIRIKIGAGCPVDTVFVGRRPTGEEYTPALAAAYPNRDWILSRILWLTGDEPGTNRGGEVDTLRRMIYIHGTPNSEPMGVPQSHGCIRMRSHDLIALFEQVEAGTPIIIKE